MNEEQWTGERRQLLLTVRLKWEKEFRMMKNKKTTSNLWKQVLSEIQEVDPEFPFSIREIYKKFVNYMVTYKRIKQRIRIGGVINTNWKFYDIMDEVYGDYNYSDIDTEEILNDETFVNFNADENQQSIRENKIQQPISIYKENEILEFLQKESNEDRRIIKELIELEKEKLRIEKAKIEEIKQLTLLLSSFSK